jgi:hypothetical protein
MKREKQITEHDALFKMRYGFYLLGGLIVLAAIIVFFYEANALEVSIIQSSEEIPYGLLASLEKIELTRGAYIYDHGSDLYIVICGGKENEEEFGISIFGNPEYTKPNDNESGMIDIFLRENVSNEFDFTKSYSYPIEVIRVAKSNSNDVVSNVFLGEERLNVEKLE